MLLEEVTLGDEMGSYRQVKRGKSDSGPGASMCKGPVARGHMAAQGQSGAGWRLVHSGAAQAAGT